MAALYVQVRTKRWSRCPDQPDPRPDPNPNPNPNLNSNPNPNPKPNPILWGALDLLSRPAGVVLSLRAILKTLHVHAIIRLVSINRWQGQAALIGSADTTEERKAILAYDSYKYIL